MLVSGGKVIAIDSIKKGNTNKDTLSGDGVWTNLGVNTNVIATTKKVDDTKSELNTKINSVSSTLSGEIQKKQDQLKFDVNQYGKITAIGNATGTTTALAGGSNVVVSAGLNTRVDTSSVGEQTIYTVNVTANPTNVTVSGENGLSARRDNNTSAYYLGLSSDYIKAITSVSSKLDKSIFDSYTATADVTPYTNANNYINISNHKISGYDWTNTIKSASSNAVNTVESRFNGDNNSYSGYNGKPFIDNTTPKWSVIGDGNRITVTSANNQYGVSWNSAGFATEDWVLGKNYLPKDVASSTYLTIASAEDIYQKKLRAGSGIVIEDDTVSVEIYVSGDLTPYSAGEGIGIDNHIVSITADYLSANALKDLSGRWESAADSLEASADKWNKTYKDVSDSAKYWNSAYDALASAELWNATYERVELSGKEWDKVSAKLDKVIYDDYVSKADSAYYSAGKGIAIDEHVISISAEYLSANALDELSGNWESTYKTVETNSAKWTSAASALEESATIWNETTNDFNTSSKIWNKTTDDFNTSSTLWNQTKEEFDVSSKLWNETKNRVDLSADVWDTVVEKLDIDDFNTWSANADITPYSGVGVISIDNHKISANLSDYYKKTETSGKYELDTKFGEIENRFVPIETDVATLKENSAHYTVESVNNYIDVNSANNKFELEFVSGDLATETWVKAQIADFGGFVTAHGTGTDNHPDVENPDVKKIYLVEGTGAPDKYREWVSMDIGQSTWGWVCIGDTSVDLTQYPTKSEVSSTYLTINSAAELYQPKGNYVTSGNYITPGSAWVLVNDDNNIQWSGLDVSELGKKYIVKSSNGSVKVGSATVGNVVTYDLSADNVPTISSEYMLSNYNSTTNKYELSGAKIVGENGVSAEYNPATNEWNVGLEEQTYCYAEAQSQVTTTTSVVEDLSNFENITMVGEDIDITSSTISMNKGLYHIDIQVNVTNKTTAPQYYDVSLTNSLSPGGLTKVFDGSFLHTETLDLSFDVKLLNDSNTLTFTLTNMPIGSEYYVRNLQIHEIVTVDSVLEATGGVYRGGTAIGITNENVINLKYDAMSGIGVTNNNEIYVKLGKGLSFTNEGGVNGSLSLDDVTEEVVETVQSMQKELDNKLTTNMNISDAKDIGNMFKNNVVASLACSLFTVPLQHNLTTASEISFFTTQGLTQSQSFPIIIGLFEYNFDYFDPTTYQYRSQTTWLGDTGPIFENTPDVKGHAVGGGANKYTFKLKHLTPVVSADIPYNDKIYHNEYGPVMRSDRAYYLAVFAKHTDGLNFVLGDAGYNAVTNSDPYISWYADNMHYVYPDGTSASMDNGWDGWNNDLCMSAFDFWNRGGEANAIVRPLVMIRSVSE